MSTIHVRLATAADLGYVGQDHFIPPEIVARKIDQEEVIIAEIDDQPVGYLRLEYLWSIVPFIALITVDPGYRRIGVGRALLDFTLHYLAAHQHEWLYSSSQADEPEPQAWHRHMGFQDCGIITGINEGGISEIFFRRRIGEVRR